MTPGRFATSLYNTAWSPSQMIRLKTYTFLNTEGLQYQCVREVLWWLSVVEWQGGVEGGSVVLGGDVGTSLIIMMPRWSAKERH